MLPAQTPSDECSDDYRVQAGDPCVPADLPDSATCDDLTAADIEVVGTDLFHLDQGDGEDGWACESGTDDRTASDDSSGLGFDVGATFVLTVITVGCAVWVWRIHRTADETESRSIQVAIALGIIGIAIALVIALWTIG